MTEQSLDEMVIELSDDSDILESRAEKELIRHIMDTSPPYLPEPVPQIVAALDPEAGALALLDPAGAVPLPPF